MLRSSLTFPLVKERSPFVRGTLKLREIERSNLIHFRHQKAGRTAGTIPGPGAVFY